MAEDGFHSGLGRRLAMGPAECRLCPGQVLQTRPVSACNSFGFRITHRSDDGAKALGAANWSLEEKRRWHCQHFGQQPDSQNHDDQQLGTQAATEKDPKGSRAHHNPYVQFVAILSWRKCWNYLCLDHSIQILSQSK
jgi:hypothetical protein